MPCSVPNQIRPCRSRHPQRNLAGRAQDRRVADLQFPVVLEDAPSVGAAAPEKALPVGLQHQRTVVFRIFPEQCLPAGGVEEHHSRGSRADDLPPVADDMMQAAFGQQAFEIVVQRVVDADAAGSGDPERTLGVSADVVDAVGGERPRIVRLALVIIIGLSVVAAKSVVGRDPDVPDFVPAAKLRIVRLGRCWTACDSAETLRRRRAATPGEACVRRSGRRWGRVDVGSGSSVVVAREAFL